jgi:protein phosphatase
MSDSDEKHRLYAHLLREQLDCLSRNVISLSDHKSPFVIHRLDAFLLIQLCQYVETIFTKEPILLPLTSPIVTVGDLHGHLGDLLRILAYHGIPSANSTLKYLFLGDIVDRGEFSLETITLIYLLKAVFPTHVFVVRGNHEFESLSFSHGFYREITLTYSSSADIFKSFLSSFSFMPLAAIVDRLTVCVHGGIGPGIDSADSITSISRPITSFASPEVRALIWSDPSADVTEFADSPRGCGFLFGEEPLLKFLERCGAVRVLRAHQFVSEGCATQFADRLVTVFSASNYCGTNENSGAVITLMPDGMDAVKDFPPLPYLRRGDAVVRRAGEEKVATPRRISTSASDTVRRGGRVPGHGSKQVWDHGDCHR